MYLPVRNNCPVGWKPIVGFPNTGQCRPPVMSSPLSDAAADYEAAVRAGVDSPEAFRKRCASYGFTKAKDGTSWDDRCIGYEEQQRLGPVYSVQTKRAGRGPLLLVIGGLVLLTLALKGM